MIFVIDVGNTNITIGIYKEKSLIDTFRLMTATPRTSDEYGMLLYDICKRSNINPDEDVEGAIVASVVPNVMHSIKNAIGKYLKCRALIVGPGIKTGIKIDTPNPKEIGADRIVDIVAGYEKYGGPLLVIDFGTATTYDLVTSDGRFTVGITALGLGTSAKALSGGTAMLPDFEIVMPKSVLANETIWSMQAGLLYGQIGATEYIINQVRKETGYDDLKVVATGGMGRLVANETKLIDEYDKNLTLEGLRIIYEKNR